MKYLKYLIIIISLLIFKINVYATNLGLSITCPSTAYSGDKVSCQIYANATNGSINGINANYLLENGTFISFEPTSGWSAYNNSSNGFVLGNINGVNGSNKIGTLNLHIDGSQGTSVKVGLTSIGASDTEYNDVSASNTSSLITIVEKPIPTTTTTKKIVTLNNLNIEGYNINFNKYIFDYTLDVAYEVTKLKINASSDSLNTIIGTGEVIIKEGENNILIKVTDPNNDTTTYKIKVNRVVKVSNIVSNNIDEINNAYKSNKELIINLDSEKEELVISQPIIDIIKNTDRKITYNIKKDEEVLYYYVFDGKKFSESYNDINLKINFINEDKVINEQIKDNKKIVFENEHKSYFPTGTKLNIKNTTNIPSNKSIKLYKLNVENNLELISNKVKKTENNYLSIDIEKGSKYIISNNNNKKSNNIIFIIISLIVIIEILVIGLLIFKRLKNNKITIPIEQ